MTTASSLAARCAARFRDSGNNVITTQEWLNYLNEAYNKVNAFSPLWPWLETSEQTITVPDSGVVGAVNNRSATLPTDVLAVNWAYDVTDDYRLIDQMGRGDFFHQDHLRSEIGQPVTYRVRNNKIELNPTPLVATTVVCECVLMPTALAVSTYNNADVAGGVAGNITVNGVLIGDELIAVMGIKDSDQSRTDFTSQFTITATNTINNSGGSATTGYHLAVVYRSVSSSNSPVFPSAWHDILIDDALAQAYLDDGNPGQAKGYADTFASKLKLMRDSLLMARTETNQPIRDTFWS
jgi:hypothetical protein